MKGRHRLCSHGSACNFLHCFRNPRGEYDWADWDSPRPRSWVAKMAKMFGYGTDREQEHDYEFNDDGRRRHRSPGSPPQREYRHSDRRSRDKHHRSNRDDRENLPRLRRHRRHEDGSDHYRPNSEDPGRGHRSHRRRDSLRFSSTTNELVERDNGHDRESYSDRLRGEGESPTRDNRELTSDAGQQQHQKRHKIVGGDTQGERIDEFMYRNSGGTSPDRSRSSNRLFQDADDDSNHKRHRSRDFRDSDRRQSLDLRSSSKGRSRTSEVGSPVDQTESRTKDLQLKEDYYEKGVEPKARDLKSRKNADNSGSIDDSDLDHGDKRHKGHYHRYSEGKSRRKTLTREHEIRSDEKSPNIDDRWTGVLAGIE